MSFIYAPIRFKSLTAKETNELLVACAMSHAKHAKEILRLAGGDDVGPHMTLLYHGHKTTAEFEGVFTSLGLEKLIFIGTVKGLFQVRNAEHNVFVLAVDVDCPPLQDLYPTVLNAVRDATGEEPDMSPHLGPNGEHLYKNDFHPHITLAYYKSGDEMDADVAAGIMNAMDALKGATVTIGPFVLHKR